MITAIQLHQQCTKQYIRDGERKNYHTKLGNGQKAGDDNTEVFIALK